MTVAVYSTHNFERSYLEKVFSGAYDVKYIGDALTIDTAFLANGYDAVSIFVNDNASVSVLRILATSGVKYLVLRSAGYNNVALDEANRLNLRVARVPNYSPYAVAEHAIAMMLALNRKLIHAHNRIMEQNFSLDGLIGFDMYKKTIGIIGTGKIGSVVAKIMNGFGCKILAHDQHENIVLKKQYGVIYTDLEALCKECDIITLHVPLTPDTKYLIDKKCISKMKKGVMLINTSRGALINTKDVIEGLKIGQLGYLGIDVYEKEMGLFFEDHFEETLQDDLIARLMTFNNVLITSHQAFLTDTALSNIAQTTLYNLECFEKNIICNNEL